MKQVIFCVETTKAACTDPRYIEKAVKNFYNINCDVKLDYVYLEGKGNYNKPHILNDIQEKCNRGSDMKNYVIYCIDTDDCNNPNSIKETKRIQRFCKKRNFGFVWFCTDIEEVFLHKKINKCNKVTEAKKFSAGTGLAKATSSSLHANSYCQYKSNLLTVLDNILTKKK